LAELSTFGEWLKRQRKAAGWTQDQLARQIHCSTSALRKMEAEERSPSAQVVERLAEILHIPLDERKAFLRFARGDWKSAPSEVMEETPWRNSRLVDQHLLRRELQISTSAQPTGTVTFLYTDIEGSTQLWKQQPQAMAAAHARHDQILRETIESNRGYVFQVVGDAFCAAFPTAADAVRAAVKAQIELDTENWGNAPIRVRMGIHTGKAKVQQDGKYSGFVTLSHVQRLMSIAHGGQVLLSFTAQELVQDELPEAVQLRDMGQRQLKDWNRPERIFQLVISGLPVDFPPLNTPESFPHNLPVQLTSFIGREREMAEIKQLLSKTHLLTLTGPGGTGKTRLALQMAEELLPSFADGVWSVEQAPLTDGSLILQTIASIFGLRELPNLPIFNIVTDYLRAKQLLLILDNCEHLVEACAKLSDHLLHSCPQLKIIATSREALEIAGETVYRVPSLTLPGQAQVTSAAVMEFEAAQLFVERASAVNPKFNLTHENASDVAQICRRLDGIPLALELAAARSSVFSPKEIASRLEDRFKLLTVGSRTALERQQTLRASIDWSYDLLSGDEQRLFRQLSVFAGGWTFEAAEAVCPDLDVLNLLTQLVDKSLVMVDADAQDGPTRYNLLETIRQYAYDRLLEADEAEQARNRHLDFFLKFAETAETYMDGPHELEWGLLLDAEYDNLRTALEWGMETAVEKALRVGSAVPLFWVKRGYEREGRRLMSEALARAKTLSSETTTPEWIMLQAKVWHALGYFANAQGDTLGSLQAFEKSAELYRQVGEKRMLARVLSGLGLANRLLGHTEAAYAAAEEAVALAREVGDKVTLGGALSNMAGVISLTEHDLKKMRAYVEEGIRLLKEAGSQWATAMTLYGYGAFASRQGFYDEARLHFKDSLALLTELKDRHRLTMIHSEFAHLERQQGHFAEAEALYRETIQEWQNIGHRAAIAHQLESFAFMAKAQEEDRRAAKLFGAAEILRENTNLPMNVVEQVEYDREVNDLRANMDEASFAKAWAEGRAMTMEQAIEFALEG
jgi:predicted ATPase/class 3 adenylate cyclase/DNA-binding XRE family transcriptional regulator